MADGDFSVIVGVELDNKSFNNLKTQIENAGADAPIKIQIDTKDASDKIDSLKKQIQELGKTGISLSGATKIEASLDDIADSVKGIKVALSSLGNVSGLNNVASAVNNVSRSFNNGIGNVRRFVGEINSISVSGANHLEYIDGVMDEFGFDPKVKEKFKNDIKSIKFDIDSITTKMDEDGSLTFTIKGVDELNRAVTAVKSIRNVFDKDGNAVDIKFDGYTKVTENLGKVDKAAAKTKSALEAVDNVDLTFDKIDADVATLNARFDKIPNKSKAAEVAVDNLNHALDELDDAIKESTNISPEDALNTEKVERNARKIVLALDSVEQAYEEAKIAVQKNKAESDSIQSREKYANNKTNLINSIERYAAKNSAALPKYGERLDALIAKINNLNGQSLDGVKQEFAELQYEIEKNGLATMSLGDRLRNQVKRYAAYFSVASLTFESVQALRQMYQQVLDVDTAMTELYRVTDLTSEGYSKLYDNMIASAKQYGATLSDIISSTADWSRAGFDANTANELAGITMMYEHIADIDYDEATENLLTAYKGFQGALDGMFNSDASEAVNYIADIFNELDNNYAVTAAGVGEAMKRSAASMDVANNSIEQTAALITGAIEVIQDPESAGNALKVVSMRLRGAKGELEDLGEEVDDNVENITKMQGQILNLTHGKVNIFEDTGDFKSTYEILQEIYNVWDELSDIEQADLLETIAGKHRANTVASILSNFGNVEKAYESALNSTGSAAKENEKYLNSLEGRLSQLTTAWQSFSNSFLGSDFLKVAVGGATGLLNALDSIVDTMGTIPSIITLIVASLSGFKNIGLIKRVKDETTGVVNSLELSFAGLRGKWHELWQSLLNKTDFSFEDKFNKNLQIDEKYLGDWINSDKTKEARDALEDATDAVKKYVKNTDDAKQSVDDFRGRQMAENLETKASVTTFKGAANAISAFNNMKSESTKTQQGFLDVVSASNPKLASYLSTVGAGNASFSRYAISLAGATAKTIGLTAASIGLNTVLTMGIGAAISLVASLIDKLVVSEEELADSVNEVTTKYKEQKDTLKSAKSLVDEVAPSDGTESRYKKLSEGVGSLGKNISLTADEYSEYLEITNKIANTFPELVQGYNSEGTAILKCKGDVDKLTEAYNKLGHAANAELLNSENITNIQEDFKNDIKDLNDGGLRNDKLTLDGAKALEKLVNSYKPGYDASKYIKGYYTQIAKALKDAKIGDYESIDPYWSSTTKIDEYVADCIETDKAAVMKIVNSHKEELNDASYEMQQAAEAALSDAFDFSDSMYYDMSDELKAIMQSAVSGLDGEFYKKVVDDGGNVVDYIESTIEALAGIDTKESSVKMAFDLQTEFNSGEVTYGEYADALAEAKVMIDNLEGVDPEIKKQLKLSLDTKGAEEQYNAFVNRLVESGWTKDAASKFARDLSSSELQVTFNLVAKGELKVENADELRKQLKEEARLMEAMSYTINMEAETESIETLTAALTEANSATGLTVESMELLKARYKDIEGYNPATLFQETANGLSLNTAAVRELEDAYANSKLNEANDNLSVLKEKYDSLTTEIQQCTDAAKKSQLINERENIRQQIINIAEYATALEGLTSAYNDWQVAESSGSNRDMYSNIYSAMENIKEELDLGWVDDGTKEYFELIWGDNWNGAGKSVSDYKTQWETLDDTIAGTTYSLEDFFKTDEDGNLTSKGIYNFFDAIKQKQKELGKEWIKTDKNGNITGFDFGIDGTKAIADAMGISEELVNIFLKASQDCGFVVTFDGTYKQLADLQNEAVAAADKLKQLGKTDYNFNFDSRSLQDLKDQLEVARGIYENPDFWNADGTFNFEVEGATEAMTVMSTLQAMVDNLDNNYIGLTVEDESFEEPLEKLQEYETVTAELNQLKLDPQVNLEEIEAAEGKLDEIVAYFMSLDDETKVKLGIDFEGTDEEVQEQIENAIKNGKVKIPTVLDLQTSIDSSIKDLVKLSLLNSGMLDDDEAVKVTQELKVKYGISDDSDTQEDAEELINQQFSGYEGRENIKVDVNTEVEGDQNVGALVDHLGELDDKEITAIANVIGNVDVEKLQFALDNLDSETIEIIAKALGEGDVETLEETIRKIPDEKVSEAIAQAFGYEDVHELCNAMDELNPKTIQAIALAFGADKVDGLKAIVNSLDDKTIRAVAEAIGQGNVQSLINTIAHLKDKTVTVKTITKNIIQTVKQGISTGASMGKSAATRRTYGGSGADGTAYADGSTGKAFKRGNWGTSDSGEALVGELGPELVVRNGRYFTVGDNGAEFFKYEKNDIIFNAGQTRQLFEQGKIVNGKTRGRAYAGGTTSGGWFVDDIVDAAIESAASGSSPSHSANGFYEGGVVPYEIQFDITGETDWLEEFNDIMEANASSTGLTQEQVDKLTQRYSKLKGFNAAKLFKNTASGIKLNTQEMSRLNSEYAKSNQATIAQDVAGLANEYNELTKSIGSATDAAKRADNITKRDTAKRNLDNIIAAGTAFSTLNNQYNKWIDAQSMPQGYDAYANVASYRDVMEDELSRGFMGSATKEYIDLLSGKDLAGATTEQYYAAYRDLYNAVGNTGYTIMDFFTLDDNGDITEQGVENFFDGIRQDFEGSVYKLNEETGEWYYDFGEENLKMIQDQWTMGIDAIGVLLQAGADAGYNINWSDLFGLIDLDTTPFEDLINCAQIAQDELSKLTGKDYKFNFVSRTIDDANAEIEKAKNTFAEFMKEDGTIDFSIPGAESVSVILRTLTIQKQQLEAPAIMKIDTTQIPAAENEVQNYIARAQEMQTAIQNYELAVNSGNEEDIATASAELQTAANNYRQAAEELSSAKPEVAAELNASVGASIANQINESLNGESVEVGAVLKIADNMTDTLGSIEVSAVAKSVEVDESALINTELYDLRASMTVQGFNPNNFFKMENGVYSLDMEAWVEAKNLNPNDYWNEDGTINLEALVGACELGSNGFWEDDGNGGRVLNFNAIATAVDMNPNGYWIDDGNGGRTLDFDAIATAKGLDPNDYWIDDGNGGRTFNLDAFATAIGLDPNGYWIEDANGRALNFNAFATAMGLDPNDYWVDDGNGGYKIDFVAFATAMGIDPNDYWVDDGNGNRTLNFDAVAIAKGLSPNDYWVEDGDGNRTLNFDAYAIALGLDPNDYWIEDGDGNRRINFEALATAIGLDPNDYWTEDSNGNKTLNFEAIAIANGLDPNDYWVENGDGSYSLYLEAFAKAANLDSNNFWTDDGNGNRILNLDAIAKLLNLDLDETRIEVKDGKVVMPVVAKVDEVDTSNARVNMGELNTQTEPTEPAKPKSKFYDASYDDKPIVSGDNNEFVKSVGKTGLSSLYDISNPENAHNFLAGLDIAQLEQLLYVQLAKALTQDGMTEEQISSYTKENAKYYEDFIKNNNFTPEQEIGFIQGMMPESALYDIEEFATWWSQLDETAQQYAKDLLGLSKIDYLGNFSEFDDSGKGITETGEEITTVGALLTDLFDTMSNMSNEDFMLMVDTTGIEDSLVDVERFKEYLTELLEIDPSKFVEVMKAIGYNNIGLDNLEMASDYIDRINGQNVTTYFEAIGLSEALTDVEHFKTWWDGLEDDERDTFISMVGEISPEFAQSLAIVTQEDQKTIVYKPNLNSIDAANAEVGKPLTKTVYYKNVEINGSSGTSNVNGTAYASGTIGRAFKSGNWGTIDSGTALMGELGPELLVRNGHYYTVGEKSAEFVKYKKGDIIFNAEQTAQIFKNGRIANGKKRGSSFATGTIKPSGRAFWGATASGSSISSMGGSVTKGTYGSSSKSSSGNSSSAADDADEFLETLDWIEVKIDRIERAISRLDLKASSVYKNWTSRNRNLADEMSEISREIDIQLKGAERYLQQAQSVGLDNYWATKVMHGEINIEDITDEDLRDKISSFTEWYNKMLDCQEAAEQLNEQLSELAQQKFDNISSEFDAVISVLEHDKNMIEEYMNQAEAQGWLTSTKYYDALIKEEEKLLAKDVKERDRLIAQFNKNIEEGLLEEGSEQWYENMKAINDKTQEILERETSMLEDRQKKQQTIWDYFDTFIDEITAINDEAEFLMDILGRNKLYEDNGQLNNAGTASMGIHGLKYNTYAYMAGKYADEIERLNKELASSTSEQYDQELKERIRELTEARWDSIQAMYDERDAIVDMVEEGINIELEALDELIDKRKEAMDSEKDLFSYQKSIEEKSKNIASIQKKLSAYAGDNSEETVQKIQELNVELAEAQEDLSETEYERYISDTEKLLDELREEYEEVLNARLDNVDALMSEMIDEINANSQMIDETLREESGKVGYNLSDAMSAVWGEKGIDGTISEYGNNFSDKLTSTNNILNTIDKRFREMLKFLGVQADEDIKDAASSNIINGSKATEDNGQNNTNTNNTKEPAKTDTSGDIAVGGKINAGNSRIYASSDGTGGGKQYFDYDPIYTVLSERNGYLLVRHHTLSSGYTGWFKKSDVSAYATGKKNLLGNELAWTQENGQEYIIRPSDGAILTPLAKGDSVLSAAASGNLWDMANSPADFIRDNLKVGDVSSAINNAGQTSVVQNFENITFNMPNVKNYGQLLSEMQKDKNFERLIMSMTIDQIAGKSSLAKGKAIR